LILLGITAVVPPNVQISAVIATQLRKACITQVIQSSGGTWKIDTTKNSNHVVLSDATVFLGELGNKVTENGGYVELGISTFLGSTSLIYDADLGLIYKKLNVQSK
jgi:hypothetical protein